MFLHRARKIKTPEFPQRLTWLNSDRLTMKKLLGKVVLIDFWTYSCVNCLRTLPHVRDWHKRYAKLGFTVIGVHTPEFGFEKDQAKVEAAIKRFDIDYPVVLDPDYKIWNLYANRWWPRKFLIDHKGTIVYDHIGEGGYGETEVEIQAALRAIGALDLPEVDADEGPGGGVCVKTSPELYLGFLRGQYGNHETIQPSKEQVFTDLDEHADDVPYLHGHWQVGPESAAHTKKLARTSEYLALRYSAFSVNLVMGLTAKKTGRVEIELDGHPLPEDMLGEDVKIDKKGKAVATIREHRMYNLVDADTYHKGMLKIKTAADNVEMFAFTFGACKGM